VPNGSFEKPATVFVNTHVDQWQKTPKPVDYDESGGYQWEQLAGVFTNTPPSSLDHIDNCDGQAIYVFAVPQIGVFQDYESTDWSHPDALHVFDTRFEVGHAYNLVVGVLGGGGGMLEGVGFDVGLYYRDDLGQRVTVATTHVTNSVANFPNHTHLFDYFVNLPVVRPTDPWAEKHLGIFLESAATSENQGGYWDVDAVRLWTVKEPVLSIGRATNSTSLQLSWPSDVGYQYQVSTSPDLLSWSETWTPLAGTGSLLTFAIPGNLGKRYYFRVDARFEP
jgi:hypothetical protein